MDGILYEIGFVGLGKIGRNFLLNLAGQGYAVAGFDKDHATMQALGQDTEDLSAFYAPSLPALVDSLATPRLVMILVPSGSATDAALQELLPLLQPGDIVIDGGNSHYRDTDRRIASVAPAGIAYLGVGVSGGEQGARNGPSLMAGGDPAAYERVRPLFEAAAARVDGNPCVAYLGPGSAGHYVKMLHNGIEYGIMQLIAESYGLLKRGLGLSNEKLHVVYDQWNREELSSYLLEVTAQIFQQVDELTGTAFIDVVRDHAGQKGTGRWSSQDAHDLEVPVPVIEMALAMRSLSASHEERETASSILAGPKHIFQGDRKAFLGELKNALYSGIIITFAQGLAQLRKASHVHQYDIKLADVARTWRGGCIIRAELLKEIGISYLEHPELANLLLDPFLGQEVMARQADLRHVVRTAVELGIPVPGLMAALAYYDSYRSDWLPLNLVQAQRAFFGGHGYERVDVPGQFYSQWHQGDQESSATSPMPTVGAGQGYEANQGE